MDKSTPVSDIMTAHVLTVSPNDSMEKVQDIFEQHTIHHIPVVEHKKIAGIISRGDYLKIQHSFTIFNTQDSEAYNEIVMRSLLVKDVMTKQVATLFPDDTVEIAAGYFRENLFHALPVIDRDSNLVGIVTTYDLLNFAFK